jgi:hypothetical protein
MLHERKCEENRDEQQDIGDVDHRRPPAPFTSRPPSSAAGPEKRAPRTSIDKTD